MPSPIYLKQLKLVDFRNYTSLNLTCSCTPVILVGPNGAGKTNLLESISLLGPGQGLRNASYADLARLETDGAWSISAHVEGYYGPVVIGTGMQSPGLPSAENDVLIASKTTPATQRNKKVYRLNGAKAPSSNYLLDHLRIISLTPTLDAIFTGTPAKRRRFVDQLITVLMPQYRTQLAQFERARRQRNRLLETGSNDHIQFASLERLIAETGTAISAIRVEFAGKITALGKKLWSGESVSAQTMQAFPHPGVSIEGEIENRLETDSALETEDYFLTQLANRRSEDRLRGSTSLGPHRSDLKVMHIPSGKPARMCSTGQQKALLLGLILLHAQLVSSQMDDVFPLVLLDEVAAHLDENHRRALFTHISQTGGQFWLTGTDEKLFAPFDGQCQYFGVDDGVITSLKF